MRVHFVVFLGLLVPASAVAQTDALEAMRQEIAEMRSFYESRIESLEDTVAMLVADRDAAQEKAVELEQAIADSNQLNADMQSFRVETETTLASIESTTADLEMSTDEGGWTGLSYHGYLRAGYGVNSHGHQHEEFVIPDGLFEIGWRLGNEKDVYGELEIAQELTQDPAGLQASVHIRPAFKFNGTKLNYQPVGTSNPDDPQFLVREAYVKLSNVYADNPDITFWAGERFYDRHDIHINDFYFLDMSGFGGGVENVPLGPGTLSVAYLGGTYDKIKSDTSGSLSENNLDVRWKDLQFLGGNNMFWWNSTYLAGSDNGAGQVVDDETGMAFGWVSDRMIGEAWNKTSVMYGFGAAADFNTYVNEWKPNGSIGEQEHFLVTHQTVFDVSENFTFMLAGLFDWEDLGTESFGQGDRQLVSLGIRPIWYLGDGPFALGMEAGVDWTDENRFTPMEGDGGMLSKITISPMIKPRGGFWTRPELRLYFTYATWSDEFEGSVGGPDYTDETSGYSFGIQSETWW